MFNLSIRLSICLSPSVCLSVCFCLSVCLSLSVGLSVCLSVYLSNFLCVIRVFNLATVMLIMKLSGIFSTGIIITFKKLETVYGSVEPKLSSYLPLTATVDVFLEPKTLLASHQ